MTTDHRRVDAELVQEVLLDEPDFLREIVERVVQQILEAEMTEHIGAAVVSIMENGCGRRLGAA
jgi:transposase-like protein